MTGKQTQAGRLIPEPKTLADLSKLDEDTVVGYWKDGSEIKADRLSVWAYKRLADSVEQVPVKRK